MNNLKYHIMLGFFVYLVGLFVGGLDFLGGISMGLFWFCFCFVWCFVLFFVVWKMLAFSDTCCTI